MTSNSVRPVLLRVTLGLIIAATPLTASAIGLPTAFGGKVVNVRPCFGSSLVVATILKSPFMTPLDVSVFPTPFLYFMMTHPGQSVLGFLGAPSFCLTSPHQGFWAPAAFFYGTSI